MKNKDGSYRTPGYKASQGDLRCQICRFFLLFMSMHRIRKIPHYLVLGRQVICEE